MCKYSHGGDAVIPGQLYPMPFLPMFPQGMPFVPGGGYDPNDSRMDMRPKYQRAPMLPRSQQEESGFVRVSGELPVIQDLTPATPRDPTDTSSSENKTPIEDIPAVGNDQMQFKSSAPQLDAPYNTQQTFPGMPFISFMPMQQAEMGMGNNTRGGYHGRGRGRGRGTFDGEVQNFRPERRDSKTLVVEKIPEDKLSLENVNDWFKRFGSVTNVAIDKAGGKALVSFSSHDEAHAAWKSEDAVFNNRFVKVFWHRPMEGQGRIGARMLAASADVLANLTANTTPSTSMPLLSPTSTKTKTSSIPASSATSALAAKQRQLEQQIAEQKSLMTSLDTATPEDKKNIMSRLRRLGEEMRTTSTTSPSVSQTSLEPPVPTADNKEKRVRDRLDKELELHSASDPSSSVPTSTEKQETTEELKAKLEKLQAEVRSILYY